MSMSGVVPWKVVECVGKLTALRDRATLNRTFLEAVCELCPVAAVSIFENVAEDGGESWMRRAQHPEANFLVVADPTWAPTELLPALDSHPQRVEAFERRTAVDWVEPGDEDMGVAAVAMTVVPMSEHTPARVVELRSEEPLDVDDLHTVRALVTVYLNMLRFFDYGERDPLTGLMNRKTFDTSFKRLAANVFDGRKPGQERRIVGSSVYLAMVDVDHFKRVNDTFGHPVGDQVLTELASLMAQVFRADDGLFRFGGEEFMVMMRCDSQVDAQGALERLRSTVERHAWPSVGQMTVSVGYTQVVHGDTSIEAIERADQAVYRAKGDGRNRVVCQMYVPPKPVSPELAAKVDEFLNSQM